MRKHPVPVVRLVVPDQAGRVLVVRRGKARHAPGQWSLPGGKVERGEAVSAAAERELREETALRCVSQRFLFYQDGLPTAARGMHCINLVFECAVAGEVRLDRSSTEHAWIGPQDLDRHPFAFGGAEALRRYWVEERPRPAGKPGTGGSRPDTMRDPEP